MRLLLRDKVGADESETPPGGFDWRGFRPGTVANNWRNRGDEGGALLGRQSERLNKLIDRRAVRSAAVSFEALDRSLAEAGPPRHLRLPEPGLDSMHPEQAAKAPGPARVEYPLIVRHLSPASSCPAGLRHDVCTPG